MEDALFEYIVNR